MNLQRGLEGLHEKTYTETSCLACCSVFNDQLVNFIKSCFSEYFRKIFQTLKIFYRKKILNIIQTSFWFSYRLILL